ncbi:MAG: glycosyltransferase family 2 protein, partial [Candidatus Pacearchaeota archaeon]
MIKTKKRPFVAIIIVNLNKKEILKKCLDSLYKKTKYKNYVVIVSDNGSTDGSVEMIKKEFKRVDLIENRKNLGFALANNVAVDYALRKYNPDYFFLLNNDTKIIQKDWLTKLVETAESDERIGIVGCNLIY